MPDELVVATEEEQVEVVEDEVVATVEDEQGETVEEVAEEETEPTKAKKPDNVPLATFLEEKKKRQELERILNQQKAEHDKLQMIQDFVTRGYPETEARFLAEERAKQRQLLDQLADKQLDIEIKELARGDRFYSDAASYSDLIKQTMREKNVGAAEAYMLLRGTARLKEVQTEREQLALNQRRKSETKKVETSTATPLKSAFKLDEDDKKALAMLQKAQPDAGWTAAKYYQTMKE